MLKKIFGSVDAYKEIPQRDDPLFAPIEWDKLPRHVAAIMDGNGRWAKGQGLLRTAGHSSGVRTLKGILSTSIGLGLEALTVYAFSTENWKRPTTEVDFLMKLFTEQLAKEMQEMHEDNVRIRFIGRLEGLPKNLQKQIREAEELMANNTGIRFNVATNYGGQDELVRAMQKVAAQAAQGNLKPEDIDEAMVEGLLDTAGDPPVDLVIRTSGDQRLSNFLLWQSAYA